MAYEYPQMTPPQIGIGFVDEHHDTYPAIDSATKSNLNGRSIFITGASKGIGRSTAISFAKAGASQIAIGARSDLTSVEADMLQAAKAAGKPAPKILRIKLDVQNLESVKNAASETEKAFGGLDVLVNNAGYLEVFTPVADSNLDEYWKTWEINYRGVYWMTRAFLPMLLKSKDGLQTIVNVSSIGAHGLRPGASGYQVGKNAILRFTEFLCAEYARQGLLAFSVHPGGVMTELAKNMPKETHSILVDTPEVAADTMVFLTQEKRTWLAGRYISCTWDMPQFLARKDEIVKGDKLKMRMVL